MEVRRKGRDMSRRLEDEVEKIVALIIGDYENGRDIDRVNLFDKPDKAQIVDIVHKLFQIVFPGYFRERMLKTYSASNRLSVLVEDLIYRLNQQIRLALPYKREFAEASESEVNAEAERIVSEFFKQIPRVRAYVETDLQAAFDGDPAAGSKEEIILAYPGLMASTVNRLAHELYLLHVPLIPRIMTEYAHTQTGIDIHPGATIGTYFFIDHGTGIVIGESTIIGDHVKIYQGVTLGALSTKGGQKLKDLKRHPTIEDNVTIYSGASILGGETVIGAESVIGGNVFITKSVPAGTRVSVKNQELIFKNSSDSSLKKQELEQDQTWYYVI